MKKTILLAITAIGLGSCVKHEVIPAPTPPVPVVTFECSFNGQIDGTSKSFISGQGGFTCTHLKKVETATGEPTTGKWDNEIQHSSSQELLQLRHGKMTWANTMALPLTTDWKAFYQGDQTPGIAEDGDGGVQLTYIDNTGTSFSTQDTSTYNNSIVYTFMEADSASNGLFLKFTASVNCKVYSEAGVSKIINAGVLKGAYHY